MTIAAGMFDRQITLQSKTVTRDRYGGETRTWADQATVWCRIVPVRSDETFSTEQLRGVDMVDFDIRYRTDVKSDWRIVFEGSNYDILSILERTRRDGLRLRAARGLREGG